MSRQDLIREAGTYLGLSAAHWACYGEAWNEVGEYRGRAEEILDALSLNEAEYQGCRDAASRRARQYIRRAYDTPGKTPIPETAEAAIEHAEVDIDVMLEPYRPKRRST